MDIFDVDLASIYQQDFVDNDIVHTNLNDSPETMAKVRETITNRPIKVTFLKQTLMLRDSPNELFHRFWREYVDYRMLHFKSESERSVEINQKMVNCEFLYIDGLASNPEALRDFKGWGLILRKAEANGLDFDFFFNVVQDWYTGRSSQWRYLQLEVEPNQEKWEQLKKLGKSVAVDGKKLNTCIESEIEITRKDGEKNHYLCFKTVDYNKTCYLNLIYFYLGPPSKELMNYNKGRY